MAELTILEPMSIGDIIDRAVKVYRKNFATLTGIIAIPSLIGYMASLLFWFGYSRLLLGIETGPSLSGLVMVVIGGLLYPLWLFSLLLSIAGLSRVVGDYVILGEPATFGKFFSAVRSRLADITVMCFLAIGIAMVLYTVLSVVLAIILIVAAIVLAAVAAAGPAAGLPPWAIGVIVGIVIAAVGIGLIILLLTVLARVVFLPQIVMIEKRTAGAALGRAISLGLGNWYKVGAIALFSYFVTTSLLSAMVLPFLVILYMMGLLSADLLVQPTWTVFYSAFSEIANLLVLPIWIIAFTLLYFDSRVRREGYDLELLTRQVDVKRREPQASPTTVTPVGRTYVQTSPLGLGGYAWSGSRAMGTPACRSCRAVLQTGARFCHVCGAEQTSEPEVKQTGESESDA